MGVLGQLSELFHEPAAISEVHLPLQIPIRGHSQLAPTSFACPAGTSAEGCSVGECKVGDTCVAEASVPEALKTEEQLTQAREEVAKLQAEGDTPTSSSGGVSQDMVKKLEERSAKFINLPQGTKRIKEVIADLKAALKTPGNMASSPGTQQLVPGIETLIQEAGPEGLGATVKDFSAALSDMSESVNMNLKKERIAMMTTQDIPELLQQTVVEMNNVNRSATFLRQKLAAITELSNLELQRAGTVGRARASKGTAVVSDEDASTEALKEADERNPDGSVRPPATPPPIETVEDPEQMRLVYEMVDKTVRGSKSQMPSSVRTEIAQAVVDILRKQAARPHIDPKLAREYLQSGGNNAPTDTELSRTDPVAAIQRANSGAAPGVGEKEVGDTRGGGQAELIQKILDQMRSNQDMTVRGNEQGSQMLGFGDIAAAPALAANAAAALGAVHAAPDLTSRRLQRTFLCPVRGQESPHSRSSVKDFF